jgi:hypothetical protein
MIILTGWAVEAYFNYAVTDSINLYYYESSYHDGDSLTYGDLQFIIASDFLCMFAAIGMFALLILEYQPGVADFIRKRAF